MTRPGAVLTPDQRAANAAAARSWRRANPARVRAYDAARRRGSEVAARLAPEGPGADFRGPLYERAIALAGGQPASHPRYDDGLWQDLVQEAVLAILSRRDPAVAVRRERDRHLQDLILLVHGLTTE